MMAEPLGRDHVRAFRSESFSSLSVGIMSEPLGRDDGRAFRSESFSSLSVGIISEQVLEASYMHIC